MGTAFSHPQSVSHGLPLLPAHPSPYPPLPPSRWEGGFGVPPAFTHTSFIGLQGGSRTSLEMTIRRKRHSPIPTPSFGRGYRAERDGAHSRSYPISLFLLPPSAGRDTRILSGIPPVPYPALRATFPTRGRQAIRGSQSPATSHQSLVTPPTQQRKSRRRFPFLAVYRKDDFQRADHTSLLKSPHVLKRARVARSWEMRLFLTASSSTMTMTLSR